jgi:site-specific recombinase XerD
MSVDTGRHSQIAPEHRRRTKRAGHGMRSSQQDATVVPYHQAMTDFMLYNRAARLANKTLGFYEHQLKKFGQFCSEREIRCIDAISATVIRAYLVDMEARGMSDYTVHAAARSIRVFLRFCVREEYIASSPMTKVAMPRIDKRILPALAPDEVHRLLNVCTSERDQAIVVFLLDTGCRVSELVNLDIADVDMKSGEVTIRRGKGRKDRVVFLGLTARRMLAAYFNERGSPDPDQPVWVSQTRSERLTLSGAQQLLRRLGQAAGVEHCSPHSFRRTFAIWSLRNGMDLFRLARLLGHTDISVLRQYLDLIKDDLAAAHAQFGTVDRMLVP